MLERARWFKKLFLLALFVIIKGLDNLKENIHIFDQ